MVILLILCSLLFIFNIILILCLFNKIKKKISNINKDIILINQSLQNLDDRISINENDFDETIKKNVQYLEQNIVALKYEFTIKLIDDIKNNIETLVSAELEKQKSK
jgi:predicted PurR-regulated permease PerM